MNSRFLLNIYYKTFQDFNRLKSSGEKTKK